jgi:tagatose 6-phosphate kinase
MIVTVTLNAAWDKTYFVFGLRRGGTHAVSEVRACPGGKGVNVARVVKALGGEVVATGFAGGATGRAITEGLAAEGIAAAFYPVAAESRATLAVVDGSGGGVTEFREPGPRITLEEFGRFLEHLEGLLTGAAYCILSGSLPPGLGPDAYAQAIRLAERCGVRTVLDSSGPALAEGLLARPFMIKPNVEEASELAHSLGMPLSGKDGDGSPLDPDPIPAATGLARYLAARAERVTLTLGAHGAVTSSEGRLWHAMVRLGRVRNPVGSGDALAAGMVVALERGDDPGEALAQGVAAGAANALTETAGLVRLEDVRRLRTEVKIRRL